MMFIEDYLHVLANSYLGIKDSDYHILNSISNQCKRGIALTDRQYNLVTEKIYLHKDKFEIFDENHLKNLRLPIREIDRSKYITVADSVEVYSGQVYETYKSKWKWIKIRFPFSKKLIGTMQNTINKYSKLHFHKNGSHTHYFKLNENTIVDIIELFKDKNFVIDQELLELYNDVKKVADSKDSIVPMYKDSVYKNFSNEAIAFIQNELGAIGNINPLILHDRRYRYGYFDVDVEIPNNKVDTLAGKIAMRTSTECFVESSNISLDTVVGSLLELDRFPLLVAVDDSRALDQIQAVFNSAREVFSPEEQIVLFREDNGNINDYTVNNFITDNKLNNWLDSNIKIVYITNKKLPKLLLKTDWKPLACLSFSKVTFRTQLSNYVKDVSDLIIFYDSNPIVQRRNGYAIDNL